MLFKNIFNLNIYELIFDENKEEESVSYFQESRFITIIYEYNKSINKSYLSNYPLILNTKKKYEKLDNILKFVNDDNLLKYICFKIKNKKTINYFNKLKEDINNVYNNLKLVEDYNIFYNIKGVKINPHYDRVDRVLVQLKGMKKILLLEPRFIKNFKEYPLLHPANRNFQNKSIRDDNSVKEYIKEYDLNEGDALYIPKFWIHEIESENESISLVLTYKDLNDGKINFKYEFDKEIDYNLYQIGGMDCIFNWNKSWILNKQPPNNLYFFYVKLREFLRKNYSNELSDIDIDNMLIKHSDSYRIFFEKNTDKIPKY